MDLKSGLQVIRSQDLSERILVRAKQSGAGQIYFSYWCPDYASAEKELQSLKEYDVDVDLVKDGKIIRYYRRKEISEDELMSLGL